MSIGYKFKGYSLKFDRGGFTKTTHKAMSMALKVAARAWLKAVMLKVPQWSGFAAGSVKFATGRSGESSGMFLYLFLKENIPIVPSHPNEHPHWKTPKQGGAKGRFYFTTNEKNFTYSFAFSTSVWYYVIQDFYNVGVSKSAPWHSLLAGQDAFEFTFQSEVMKRLPRLKDYLVKATVRNK